MGSIPILIYAAYRVIRNIVKGLIEAEIQKLQNTFTETLRVIESIKTDKAQFISKVMTLEDDIKSTDLDVREVQTNVANIKEVINDIRGRI